MPVFGPIKRRELIQALRRAGFEGPYAGGKHQYMVRGEVHLTLPTPTGKRLGETCWRVF